MLDTPLDTLIAALPLQPSTRMPVLFVGHGSPMNVLEDNVWRYGWQDLGQALLTTYPRPQAIVCISAHWQTVGHWALTGSPTPATLHDFSGFPAALYAQRYPAPGHPALAQALAAYLQAEGDPAVQVDPERGLDHGAWGVLQPMFAQADIPVLQLSMAYPHSAQAHWDMGQRLAALRTRGVLLVASGNLVHNLGTLRQGTGVNATYTWALQFDERVADLILAGQLAALTKFAEWGDLTEVAHPTPEHFLPLLYAAAAVLPGDTPRFFNAGFQMASISMRSVIWEPPTSA